MTDSSISYSHDTTTATTSAPNLKLQEASRSFIVGDQDLTERHLSLQDQQDSLLHSSVDSESEEDVTEAIQDNNNNNNNNSNSTALLADQVFYDAPPIARMRSISNVGTPSPSHTPILLPRAQRVWEVDRATSQCRRCDRHFTFLVRRHHCRRCGQIICDKCSLHRMRLPVDELVEDPMVSRAQYSYLATQPQRVCDFCYSIPIRRASESASTLQRSDSLQSLLLDCPVCGRNFLGLGKIEQEEHLKQCLNMGGPPTVHAPRYIVYKLANDSTQIGNECPICFDEFCPGDKIARMICLCSFHQHCLADWLERGKGCPVHYDSLHI